MQKLTVGSVCSGIEAASVAWRPMGMRFAWHSEIERFPCAVLDHHYPETPNLGDVTKITENDLERHGPIDILVGGTPCQSFSVAGLRKGLDDPRGNLALRFVQLADYLRPAWVVWENVPGVLSGWSGEPEDETVAEWEETADFDAFTFALWQCGYHLAWRVLDAQYFGVPQRRRRVFVVGHLGDWRRAAAVLFERESTRRDDPPMQPRVSPEAWLHGHGRVAGCIDAQYGKKWGSNQWYARGHVVCRRGWPSRMMPIEVERCFGFPDHYTKIPYRGKPADQCPDGPRYKALGNSMARYVMVWIGRRILETEGGLDVS